MTATLLIIHILLAVCLIGVILVQRSSSDGGGIMGGGGASSLGGLMSVRGTANLLTRLTQYLAGGFIITSIVLTIMAGAHRNAPSLSDQIKPVEATDVKPTEPEAPSVPVSK
jgi:preprotein translocase subunit SecG